MPDYVVLDPSDDQAGVAAAVEELAAGGAVVQEGWVVAPRRSSTAVLCVGVVEDEQDAAAAVLAAVAGARLVVTARADQDVIDRLCDDLRRLGSLEHRTSTPAGDDLTAEQRALVRLLLRGATLGEASRQLHVSRRTLDRRWAAVRAALGATTTAEALHVARRRGLGGGGDPIS